MLITISGLSGSGKSTAAELLAKRLGIPTVDTGVIFRKLAMKHGMDVHEFGAYALKHPEVDRELDALMMRKAKRSGSMVLQGRLAGWMTHRHEVDAFRIWLKAPLQTRASRIAKREHTPYKTSLNKTRKRDKANRSRYKAIYGLDLKDLSVYDSVVRTGNLSADEVVDVLIGQISKVWRKKRRQPKSSKRRQVAPLHRKKQRPTTRNPRRKK